MRRVIGLTLVLCAYLAQAVRGDDPKQDPKLELFVVDGVFSIETPIGFKWTEDAYRNTRLTPGETSVQHWSRCENRAKVVIQLDVATKPGGEAP